MAFGNTPTANKSSGISSNVGTFANAGAGSLAHENTNKFGREATDNMYQDKNRRKKRKNPDEGKDPQELSTEVKLRLATTDARTLPFTQWMMNLRGPAKWCSEKEQRAFYEFGYGSETVNDAIKRRLHKGIILGICASIASCLVIPIMFKHSLSGIKLIAVAILIGVIIGWLIWVLGARASMRAYNNMLYERQLVFIQFERLLIPYLSEMKNGVSLFSMLKRVARRLPDEGDQMLVQRLMSAIAEGTTTSEPFVDFARRFGGSDSARLFMMSIYQMYSGNYNDAVVKDLGDQSNQQMMSQVDLIIKRKLKRFNNLTTWLTMGIMLIIIGYLGSVMFNAFSRAMHMMPG